MTSYQKGLKVVSIVVIILAVLSIIVSLLVLLSGAGSMFFSGDADLLAEAGISASDAQTFGTFAIVLGIYALIIGVLSLITGIFGTGAAKDTSKIGRAFKMGVVILVLEAIHVVLNFIPSNLTSIPSAIVNSVVSLIVPILYVYFASKVKKGEQ